jgi:hypothetical protein
VGNDGPFKMVHIHQGSRGSRADITNCDIVVSQLIGTRLGRGRAHAIALAGGAIVFSRRTDDVLASQNPNSDGSPRPPIHSIETDTNFNLALAGGLDVPIQVNARVAITPRVRLRVAVSFIGMPAPWAPSLKMCISAGTRALRSARK